MIRRLQDYGNLYFECDDCKVQVDSKSNKMYGIQLPVGWEARERKLQSQEGTKQTEGTNHFCHNCG